MVLAAAFAARLVFVGALVIGGLPHHSDLSVGALKGDEVYILSRALRSRDILLGFPTTFYDYFIATDLYGQTSYLSLLTAIQVLFGPTPYSMRLLNSLLYAAGATLLFRTARVAFGFAPAFGGLVVALFLPSLFVGSTSLLKEPAYFLVTSVLIVCSVQAARARTIFNLALALVLVGASLWALNDLRRGALPLALLGIGLGFGIRVVAGHRWRVTAVLGAVFLCALITVTLPALRACAIDWVEVAAKMHAGHVFTVGHAYTLMDDGFYLTRDLALTLTEPQALRFLVRAAISFVVTPLPWEMASLRELAFLPEHLVWYLMLAILPFGVVAGWKRDPLVTAVLLGYVVPTAAAVALTNGNVGTLLRLRGLVSPYLIWLSVLGLLTIVDALLNGRMHAWQRVGPKLATEGPAA
jgi:hypothetical protein